MADPLSVSASIAGLVTLADIVFIRAVKYIKSAKGAADEVKSICDSLQSLSGALHGLSLFAARLDAESDAEDYPADFRPRLVHSCTQLLGDIRKKLEKHDPSEPGLSRAHSAFRQLKWPFATQEVKDILEKIEQHKSALVLALSADTFQALQDVLSAHRSFQNDLAEIKSAIAEQRRISEAHLSSLYSEKEQRDIYAFFGSESPEDRHRTNMRLRHRETGLWLLDDDDFIAWIDGRSPKLWLTGIPGAGKTVLASVIIEEACSRVWIGRIAVAYFYCDYKDTNSQCPVKIFGSIATQLAQQSVEAFELLRKLYKKCHPVSRMSRSPEASSLVYTIRQMCGFFENVHLIVDGLDECGEHAREVTSFLRQIDQPTKSGKDLNIALLSRSEEVIRQQLKNEFVHVQVSARNEDLRLYVASEMENRIRDGRLDLSSASMRDEILKALVEGADGMFRWVTCQMDYLCEQASEYDMRSALRSLPPSLDESYRRILERVNTRSAQIQTLVQKTLRWLIYHYPVLSEADLCVAVSISEDMAHLDPTRQPTIRAIMTHCSSLVRRPSGTNRLELAHFTVREFLTTEVKLDIPSLAPYILTQEASILEMARACVTYAAFPEFDQPLFSDYHEWSKWIDEYPFRRVAVVGLVHYAREQWSDPFIFGKMKQLFRPPRSKQFLRFAQDSIFERMKHMCMAHSTSDKDRLIAPRFQGATELHLAAYLKNAPLCKWLIESGCSVNDLGSLGSPLHWVLLEEQAVEFGCRREITDDIHAPILWVNSNTLDVLRIIVEAGANGRCRFFDAGGTGHSILSLVRCPIQEETRVHEVVRLLLSAGAQADEEFLDIMDAVRGEGRVKQVWATLDCFQPQNIQYSCKHKFKDLCRLVNSHSPLRQQYLEDSRHFSDEQTPGSSSNVERFHHASLMDEPRPTQDMLEARLVDVNSASELIHDGRTNDEVEPQSLPGCRKRGSVADQALNDAIESGDKELLLHLLDSGAIVDHDLVCRCGCSPALFALQCQQLDMLRLLLSKGFVLSGHACAGSPDPGACPAHLALRFAPDDETLNTILNESQAGDLHLGHAIHPVHFAVGIHNNDGLMFLLTYYGCMSRFDALEARRHPLLDIAINVNEVCGPYNISEDLSAQALHGSTPLHLAAHVNNVGAVFILMDSKADIESRNARFETPLHVATLKGSILALKALLRYGANIYARDGRGWTPVECSVLTGNLQALVELERHGANIHTSRSAEVNLMTLASRSASNEVLVYLLSRSCAQIGNRFGDFPVRAAWNRRDVTPALLLNSAMLASIYPDHIDGIGASSLIGSQQSSLLKQLWKRMPSDCTARDTIDTKAQLAEMSPLCYAAFVGNDEAVDLLVCFGANVNVEGSHDGTPLMAACKAGHLPTVAVLVRHGASEVYLNGKEAISAFIAAENFPYIQRWLLVDRYTEQAKIKNTSGSSDQSRREYWAGPQSLRVPLTSQFGRFVDESTIDHLLRLRRLRESFEGKVLSWPVGAEHPFIILS